MDKEINKANQFTYIIGNNGVGKSLKLELDAQLESKRTDVVVISSGLSDKFTWGGTTKLRKAGSYTYLGNRTVGNAIHINTISANATLNYVQCLKRQTQGAFLNLLSDIGFDRRIGIMPREVRKRKNIEQASFEPAELSMDFVAANEAVLSNKAKPFDLVLTKKNGLPMQFAKFSSGEQNMISMALKILSRRASNVIFYIDEPEISLHLEWQLSWPKLMHELIVDFSGCKFIVATHSPVMIVSALTSGATCYNMCSDRLLRRINSSELNIEALMFGEFHTLTPHNKAIYEQYAHVLHMALNYANSTIAGGHDVAQAGRIEREVDKLIEKAHAVSALLQDKSELIQSVKEFEGAIEELMTRAAKGEGRL
jgi:predicted ATPase